MALAFEWQHQFLMSCSQVILGCSVIAASELGLLGQGFLLAREEWAEDREKQGALGLQSLEEQLLWEAGAICRCIFQVSAQPRMQQGCPCKA